MIGTAPSDIKVESGEAGSPKTHVSESGLPDGSVTELMEEYGRSFAQGEVIFREGDVAAEVYLLHRGRVRLFKRVRMVDRNLSVLQKGGIFGESALLSGAVRTSTAVALSEGVVLAFDSAALRRVAGRIPTFSELILQTLVQRLGDAEDQIEVLLLRDTQSKVIGALLKLGRSESGGSHLSLSPVELSSRVGVDVETVKRTMQRLRDQQYVKIVGERIELLDLDALRRLYLLLGSKDELHGER